MRIGLVCPYDLGAAGGVQDQVVLLAAWLREAGHDVIVVGPGTADLAGFVSAGPVTVVPANGAATPLALHRDAASKTLEALAAVDVVHLHEPLMPQVCLAALRDAPASLVGTFHAAPSRMGRSVYSLARPVTRRWLSRLAVKTAVSAVAAEPLSGPVRIIPNGIDTAAYRSKGKTGATVMFLGRDDERKGLAVLLAAWPTVVARVPEARLTVVGAAADGRSLPRVTFTGRVSDAEKRAHLAETEVFCAPNLGGESFGIVVAEAMAAGCAVVASGLRSFVQVAGAAAEYVPPRDSAGLAGAIVALLTDHPRRSALAAEAVVTSRRFDVGIVAGAYLDTYAEAIARHQG